MIMNGGRSGNSGPSVTEGAMAFRRACRPSPGGQLATVRNPVGLEFLERDRSLLHGRHDPLSEKSGRQRRSGRGGIEGTSLRAGWSPEARRASRSRAILSRKRRVATGTEVSAIVGFQNSRLWRVGG